MIYSNIAALIPFYDTNGQNSTKILLKDGSKQYAPSHIKVYISRMLYTLHLDPKALKHWTHEITGEKLNTPIVIDEHLIFIPVKLRKSIGKQDGSFGYVNILALTSIDDYQLTLTNNLTLTTLSTKSYITRKQTTAKLLSYSYVAYKKQYEFMWKD